MLPSSDDECLGWLSFLAVMNKVAVNMKEQASLWYVDLESSRYVPRSDTAGLHDSLLCKFLEKFPHCFLWRLHRFTYFQQCWGCLSPNVSTTFCCYLFSNLDCDKIESHGSFNSFAWWLRLLNIFVNCLKVICASGSENCLFSSFTHTLFGWLLLLNFQSSLYILCNYPLSDAQDFSPFFMMSIFYLF